MIAIPVKIRFKRKKLALSGLIQPVSWCGYEGILRSFMGEHKTWRLAMVFVLSGGCLMHCYHCSVLVTSVIVVCFTNTLIQATHTHSFHHLQHTVHALHGLRGLLQVISQQNSYIDIAAQWHRDNFPRIS